MPFVVARSLACVLRWAIRKLTATYPPRAMVLCQDPDGRGTSRPYPQLSKEDVDPVLHGLRLRTNIFVLYNSAICWRRRPVVPIVRDRHCVGHEDEG